MGDRRPALLPDHHLAASRHPNRPHRSSTASRPWMGHRTRPGPPAPARSSPPSGAPCKAPSRTWIPRWHGPGRKLGSQPVQAVGPAVGGGERCCGIGLGQSLPWTLEGVQGTGSQPGRFVQGRRGVAAPQVPVRGVEPVQRALVVAIQVRQVGGGDRPVAARSALVATRASVATASDAARRAAARSSAGSARHRSMRPYASATQIGLYCTLSRSGGAPTRSNVSATRSNASPRSRCSTAMCAWVACRRPHRHCDR
jgi:hypothetical protein